MFPRPPGSRRLLASAAEACRSRRGLARGARLVVTVFVAVAALALLLFHAALFWAEFGDGRLLDPAVAMRWGIGALLLGAIVVLRRSGVPVLWGRRALVVWVLVALLHWTAAPATDAGNIARPGTIATQILVDLPATAAATMLFAAALLLLLAAGARFRQSVASLRVGVTAPRTARTPLLSRHLASRAPPALCA